MYAEKYYPKILLLVYFFSVSNAFFFSNPWLLLTGPLTHGILYILLKAMRVFLNEQ